MSLDNYFKIMKVTTEFNTEYEIFGDAFDSEDCQDWAKATKEATGDKLKGLRVCDTVGDCIDYLDQVQAEYLAKAKRQTNPSPRLEKLLKSYFEFRFREEEKGFIDSEDLEDYNKDLYDCLKGCDAKNFEPLTDTLKISTKYWEIIETEVYNSFKGYKLEFMEAFKLVVAFVEAYEGRSLETEGEELLAELGKDGIYNSFFESETLGELLDSFADWCDWFIYADDWGEPTTDLKGEEFAHLINWRAL